MMHKYKPWQAALLWDTHNAAFMGLARKGTPVLRSQYEAFLDDPAGTVAAIGEFLGVALDPASLFIDAHTVDLKPTHLVAGNPMRFRTGPLALKRDDAWQHSLPRGSRALVSSLTFPLMARYGYFGRDRSTP